MRTPIFKFLVIVLLITSNSCKNEPKIAYQFESSPKVLACEFENSKLYNEAIHSFEKDITAFYDKAGTNPSRAYTSFINNTMNNRIKVEEIASNHSLQLALALKKESNLWNTKNPETTLNYSHPLVDCIVNNIKTQYLKQTFNALLATNSMRKNVVLPPLQGAARSIQADGSLKSFLAFEYYFPKLWNLKPEDIKTPAETNSKLDFNKTPAVTTPTKAQPKTETKKVESDPHAGHNHE